MRKEAAKVAKKFSVPKQITEPSLLSVAESEMDKIAWYQINEDLSPAKIAFATKTKDNCYKVFVNNKVPEVYRDHLRLHEYGHILFGHLKFDELRHNQLTKKILQNWGTISKHLQLEPEDIGKDKIELVGKYIMPLQGLLSNYAMDMEVNSKLFPNDEEPYFNEILGGATLMANLNDDLILDVQLEKIEEYLDGDRAEPFAKAIFPSNYDFPNAKSYLEYLDLMFLNIDKFIDFMKRDLEQFEQNQEGQGGQGQGQDQGNSGSGASSNSNGKGKPNVNKNNKQNNNGNGQDELSDADKERLKQQAQRESKHAMKQLSLDDIEKLRKAANGSDTDEKSNNDAASSTGHGDQASEDPANARGAASSPDVGDAAGEPEWSGEAGLGVGHAAKERPDVIPLGNGRQLARYLEQQAFSKKIENLRQNTMWNYNRRKYGEVDIISKLTKENVYRPGNIYIIVDCSGSIDERAIGKMLDVIKQLSKKCGPKSRVIWWDTRLCSDKLLRSEQKPICGGGTDIAGGIAYVRKNYLKNSNDKLIIISDYYDTLSKWVRECRLIKNDITGICWTNNERMRTTDEFLNDRNYGGQFNVREFKRRIPTKIVEI